MLRQIKLDKFPKKVTNFRPQILNSLITFERRPFDPAIPKLLAYDQTAQNKTYQIYIARKLNQSIKQNFQFLKNVPNILLLEHQPLSLIVQQPIQYTLKEFLSRKQAQTSTPYISQTEARSLLCDLIDSLQNFQKNNLQYPCLNDHNVVKLNGRWMLSLAGAVANSFYDDRNFYDSKKKEVTYALGSLLFKLLFGFVPFQQNPKKPQQFRLTHFIDYLQQQSIKKLPKIYSFSDRIQVLSPITRSLIEDLLSSKFNSLSQLKQHKFFFTQKLSSEQPRKQFNENREIKMLDYFDKRYHSLIMAAIERKKKHPYERLHSKMDSDVSGFMQLKDIFSKDSFMRCLNFEDVRTQSEIKRQEENYNNLKIECKYFDADFDFEQKQRPTLELIKFIEKDKSKNPDLYETSDREARIKLYAYPYTMAFELANVYMQQPIEIKKKIEQLVPYLLELSSMYWPVERLVCLHHTKLKHTKFEDIKLKYRQLINFLYKHFLTEAMKRYNAKKQNLTIGQKIRLKEQGLQYYRLCLKLMEASLIVRKAGKDLDLQRIQTSQRKQIEQDLQSILKTYFPNRVQIK